MALATLPPKKSKQAAKPACKATSPLVRSMKAMGVLDDGVLLPYQKLWIADESQVKACDKSRRIGLSYAEAADSALLASRATGMDVWYVGYNKDMAKEFIRDTAFWAKAYNLAASAMEIGEEIFEEGDERRAIVTFSITFASGFRVTALSSSPSNLRGKQGRVILDEAAFHPNLKELLKSALALTMWGGQVHIISTHNGVDNPFNQLLEEVRAGKKDYSLHRITFADAIADGLYRRIALVTGQTWTQAAQDKWIATIRNFYGDDAAEELDCVPALGGGKYFSIPLIESCMSDETPILRIKREPEFVFLPVEEREADINDWCNTVLLPVMQATLPPDARSYYAHDFARKVDLTEIVPLYMLDDLTRRVPFVVEMSCMPFDQQQQVINFVIDHLPNFIGGALDAGGNGAQVAEKTMTRYGATRIEQVMLSEAWYMAHMPKLKAAFEDRTIAGIPRHADLRDDLRTVELVKGIPKIVERTKSEADKKQKRHGDFAIALALAIYATFEMCQGPVRVASRGSEPANHRSGHGRGRGRGRRRARGYSVTEEYQ